MSRTSISLLMLIAVVFTVRAQYRGAIVADSLTRQPLGGASVFDRHGKLVGICSQGGIMPYIGDDDYPLVLRCLGFRERTVTAGGADTVFMQESVLELPEFSVETKSRRMLHILAYVREYSTLTTYSDTVFMFREKMVDYMLPQDRKVRFKGWRTPRVLTSRSYYRFTNGEGLDSVSDCCNYHFSWADWIGLTHPVRLPSSLMDASQASDTVYGLYSPAEIWRRDGERLTLDVNVLADTVSRKWVPDLSVFFRKYIDFEQFRIKFSYDNIYGDFIGPTDLSAYSFNIESNGRGHGMFMFNKVDEPFFVSTYAEVYMMDKEYITVKEAKKWESRNVGDGDMAILVPPEAPELQPSIAALVERVSTVDHDKVRLALVPDKRLAGRSVEKMNFGQKALSRLKGMLGIDHVNARRKWNNQWKSFRNDFRKKNNRGGK